MCCPFITTALQLAQPLRRTPLASSLHPCLALAAYCCMRHSWLPPWFCMIPQQQQQVSRTCAVVMLVPSLPCPPLLLKQPLVTCALCRRAHCNPCFAFAGTLPSCGSCVKLFSTLLTCIGSIVAARPAPVLLYAPNPPWLHPAVVPSTRKDQQQQVRRCRIVPVAVASPSTLVPIKHHPVYSLAASG